MIGVKKYKLPEGVEVVSATHDFKFIASDGKRRLADTITNQDVEFLAWH